MVVPIAANPELPKGVTAVDEYYNVKTYKSFIT